MSVKRKVRKVGGSLGVLLPRDFAESANVQDGSDVRVSLVGRSFVIEPEDDTIDEESFRRAYAKVLRRYGKAFEELAAHDRGEFRARGRVAR